MYEIMFKLHVLSAVGIGFYMILPFVAARLSSLDAGKLPGYAGSLVTMNRIGQYILVVTFLTGGAMVSKAPVSTAWWILATILVVIIFATAGMMTRPLKKLAEQGMEALTQASKIRVFSAINALALLLAVLLMVNPSLFR